MWTLLGFAPAVAALLVAAPARAAPTCAGLTHPIYLAGSGSLANTFHQIAGVLAKDATNPHALAFFAENSCDGVKRLAAHGVVAKGATLGYIDATVDPNGTLPTCVLDADVTPDVVVSDVSPASCPAVLASVNDDQVAVNDFGFVVNLASTANAISAEQAYLVFGFGAAPPGGPIAPWTDYNQLWLRSAGASTTQVLAEIIGVPANRWQGPIAPGNNSQGVVTAVSQSTEPLQAIGILDGAAYDASRDRVKLLAFRAFGQKRAYWPDALPAATSHDRRNVRDGHYAAWSAFHVFAAKSAAGAFVSAGASLLADLMSERVVRPGLDIAQILTNSHFIPACAMNVSRETDSDVPRASTPLKPCGCSFEAQMNGGVAPVGCRACTSDSQCGGAVCRRLFCEAH